MGKVDIISVKPIANSNNDLFYQNSIEEEKQKNKSYDIVYTLKPLHVLLRLFGMSRTPYFSDFTKRVHFLLMLSVLLCAIMWTLHLRLTYIYPKMAKIVQIMDMVDLFTMSAMAICNLLVTAIQSKCVYLSIYKNFLVIDSIININISERYRNARTVVLKVMFFIIMPLFLICAIELYSILRMHNLNYSSASFINYALYFLNCLVSTQFIISMYSVRINFYTLNCQLNYYIEKYKNTNFDNSKLSEDYTLIEKYLFSFEYLKKISRERLSNVKFDVQKFTNIYMVNCDQCDLFNSYYSIQNFLIAFSGIISILKSLHTASVYALHKQDKIDKESNILLIIATSNFALYDVVILYFITASCEFVVSEANKTSRLLDRMISYRATDSLEDVALNAQLISRRIPKFTAWGLFSIDFTLLFGMAGTITTYLIMLIQNVNT